MRFENPGASFIIIIIIIINFFIFEKKNLNAITSFKLAKQVSFLK